jgi:hypothetical protein
MYGMEIAIIINPSTIITDIQMPLLNGIEKEKNGNKEPYVTLGYVYLNSFIQKDLNGYITNNNGDDIISVYGSLAKFSAINEIPYIWMLYIGSIWHRYKTWIDSDIDILDDLKIKPIVRAILEMVDEISQPEIITD